MRHFTSNIAEGERNVPEGMLSRNSYSSERRKSSIAMFAVLIIYRKQLQGLSKGKRKKYKTIVSQFGNNHAPTKKESLCDSRTEEAISILFNTKR